MKLSDISPGDLRDRLRRSGMFLRTGPFTTHLRTSIPAVASFVHRMYCDFPARESGEFADFHVRLARPAGLRRFVRSQVLFRVNGNVPFNPAPLRQAPTLLEWGLNWCVASLANNFLIIHSGVVERNGRAVLFAAPPGFGKSTLCAALTTRGWRLLSDEFALVRLDDSMLQPLPRPVGLKDRSIGVIREFSPDAVLGPVIHGTHKGTIAHMRPPCDSVQKSDVTARSRWIVFPRYESGSSASVTPLSRARAFLRLADHSFNYTLLGRRGFETLANVIDGCECYEFRFADIGEAVDALSALESSQRPGDVATR